jgi:hypothetical protein
MTFWHTKRPKHESTLLTHDIALPLIKHNSGNTHCNVGKKMDHHDSPQNNVTLANLFDRYCALSPCTLRVPNVTFLTFLHHTFFLHTNLDVGYHSNFLTFYPYPNRKMIKHNWHVDFHSFCILSSSCHFLLIKMKMEKDHHRPS